MIQKLLHDEVLKLYAIGYIPIKLNKNGKFVDKSSSINTFLLKKIRKENVLKINLTFGQSNSASFYKNNSINFGDIFHLIIINY